MIKLVSREAALLLLRALEERGQRRGKMLTRARLSEITLKTLWGRETLTREWLDQVNEYLLSAGWLLIDASSTYAAVKIGVVEAWPRVASKHLDAELKQIRAGTFDFGSLEELLDKSAWDDPPPAVMKAKKLTSKR
jgi:hypothetical protein